MKLSPIHLSLALAFGAACGSDDEEKPVSPQEYCVEKGVSGFIQGEIMRPDQEPLSIRVSAPELPFGSVVNGEVQIEFGQADVDGQMVPLHLRILENQDSKSLLDLYANATVDGPASLQVFDATQVDVMATQRSNIGVYDCGIADGNQCAQLAFDSTGEDVISDSDLAVYNGGGGTVTVVEIGSPRRLYLQFDIALGSNVLTANDTSTGRVQGCINARYTAAAQGVTLK